MSNPGLIKTRDAQSAIKGSRILKHGTADYSCVHAAAATDKFAGVSERIDVAAGRRVDVIKSGLALLVYGGTVARGDPLTSDAEGRGIKAAPGSGAKMEIIGYAEISGVLNDIGEVDINRGTIKG